MTGLTNRSHTCQNEAGPIAISTGLGRVKQEYAEMNVKEEEHLLKQDAKPFRNENQSLQVGGSLGLHGLCSYFHRD